MIDQQQDPSQDPSQVAADTDEQPTTAGAPADDEQEAAVDAFTAEHEDDGATPDGSSETNAPDPGE